MLWVLLESDCGERLGAFIEFSISDFWTIKLSLSFKTDASERAIV
jgi:hypothetical protein